MRREIFAFDPLQETLSVLDPVHGLEDETVSIYHFQLGIIHECLVGQPLKGEAQLVRT